MFLRFGHVEKAVVKRIEKHKKDPNIQEKDILDYYVKAYLKE